MANENHSDMSPFITTNEYYLFKSDRKVKNK